MNETKYINYVNDLIKIILNYIHIETHTHNKKGEREKEECEWERIRILCKIQRFCFHKTFVREKETFIRKVTNKA